MTQLTLYGFGLNDRSGKIRWLAHELGIDITEERLGLGAHRKPPYTDLNPYGMVPTTLWRGHTLIESFATLTLIAETTAMDRGELGLVVEAGEPDRAAYLQWCSLFAETFEGKLVEFVISRAGLLPAAVAELSERRLRSRVGVLLGQLPKSGFLVAGRFTLADMQAAYTLRLAISGGLCELADVADYLGPLMARPAAVEARFFSAITPSE
ncbi:MAG: glutathione S-transferase family protein [Myxococcales bacterium]|nr:glutathione S-transferase family protein [Myxococcales bacterium]